MTKKENSTTSSGERESTRNTTLKTFSEVPILTPYSGTWGSAHSAAVSAASWNESSVDSEASRVTGIPAVHPEAKILSTICRLASTRSPVERREKSNFPGLQSAENATGPGPSPEAQGRLVAPVTAEARYKQCVEPASLNSFR